MAQAPTSTVPRKRTARDYQFGTKIGEGSYSTVYLAVDIYNNKTYAIKVLSKKHIVKENKIKYVNIEKTTLHRLGQQHPGIVQLYYTFQDENSLFFVLDFAEYGELLLIIAKFGLLLEPVLRFYMAQIVDAVRFIHLKGVIHRDLKPENILVGYDFNLKITDFGAAKLLGDVDETQDEINYDAIQANAHSDPDRKGSFVGTAEYVPPELLQHNTCGFETDIWAMGCILYQFFHGLPPFKGSTEYLTFEKIIALDFSYRSPIPVPARDIVDRILVYEPHKRLTILQIQEMPWFSEVVWERDYIWGRKVPRFEPYSPNGNYGSNYSPKYSKTRKSNSNYQLAQQLLYDFDLPVGKKLFQPPTRIKKGMAIQKMNVPVPGQSVPAPQTQPLRPQNSGQLLQGLPAIQPQLMPGKAQSGQMAELPRQSQAYPYGQPLMSSHPGQPGQSAPPQGPGQSASSPKQSYPKAGRHPWKPLSNSGHPYALLPSPNGLTTQVPPAPINVTSQNAARLALAPVPPLSHPESSPSVPVLEKKMADVQISPRSPQRTNLRIGTAFAKAKGSSTPKSSLPQPQLPQPCLPQLAIAAAKAAGPAPPKKDTKLRLQLPIIKNTVTFKEILSFLEPGEKIIKLDTILKLTLSNRVINRKPGSLDDVSIERLIRNYQEVLDRHMVPIVACVSNKARVFLVDATLGVMLVDLTANKGGDYLMYDYEFESIMVDDDASELSEGEEVYGYLILELIKEGGDLIFLKRFSDSDKQRFAEPTRVVGKNGEYVRLGVNLGWIDCLIYAKEVVDKEKKEHHRESKQEKKIKPVKRSAPKKNTRPSKVASPQQDKKSLKNFALSAAAAAAHR